MSCMCTATDMQLDNRAGAPWQRRRRHDLLRLPGNRIVRVLFCIEAGQVVLLHDFIKKTKKTTKADLDLALKRKRGLEGR